jgi:hypothetical protein
VTNQTAARRERYARALLGPDAAGTLDAAADEMLDAVMAVADEEIAATQYARALAVPPPGEAAAYIRDRLTPAAPAVQPPAADRATPSRRAELRDEIAAAIWERQNPGRRYADCDYRWRADAEADAAAIMPVLYREWPWLRAEAEEVAPAVPAADRAAVFASVRPHTLASIACHLDARAVAIMRPDSQTYAEWQTVIAELRRMSDETQPAQHACGNCEGIDPATCLTNSGRTADETPQPGARS